MRDYIFHNLPRPKTRASEYTRQCRQLVILLHKPSPTYEYYISQRVSLYKEMGLPVHVLTNEVADTSILENSFVIICRYIRHKQLNWLEKNKSILAGVGLLIDDDIASVISDREAPAGYKVFAGYLGLLPLRRLNSLLSIVWVSTPGLEQTLNSADCKTAVLSPFPEMTQSLSSDHNHESIDPGAISKKLRIVYHATVTHFRGHEFLKPIMENILKRHTQISFEVFGRSRARKLWKNAAINPSQLEFKSILPWPEYVQHCIRNPADVAMAPLFDSDVDNARSDTKRIDIARLKAAAIFSSNSVYTRCRQQNEIFVENNPKLWEEATERLILDEISRENAVRATFASVNEMRCHAIKEFPGIKITLD
ncbi:MAG: hypothetical protein AAGF54_20570 [Pseudomonadota bacterium]